MYIKEKIIIYDLTRALFTLMTIDHFYSTPTNYFSIKTSLKNSNKMWTKRKKAKLQCKILNVSKLNIIINNIFFLLHYIF